MKLPSIDYGGRAESLGAELKLRTAGSWAHAFEALGDAARNYVNTREQEAFTEYKNEAIAQTEEQRLRLRTPYQEVENIPAGINYQTTEERLASGQTTTVPRTQIPTYEVQTQMMDNHLSNLDKNAQANLSRGAYKRWQNWFSQYATAVRTRNGVAQFDAARAADRAKLEQSVESLVGVGKYEDAEIAVAQSAHHSEQEKQRILGNLRKEQETRQHRDVLIQENPEALQETMAVLSSPEYQGTFTPAERKIKVAQTQRVLSRVTNRREGAKKARIQSVQQAADESILALKNGAPPREDISDLTAALYEQEDYARADALEMAVAQSALLAEVSHVPEEQQQAIFDAWIDDADSREDVQMVREVQAMLQEQQRHIRNDTPGFAAKSGNFEISPIDWAGDSADLEAQLVKRGGDIRNIRAQINNVSGYLSDQEAASFNAAMTKAKSAERTQMMDTVNRAFGDEASVVWDQAKRHDTAGVYAKAGEISAYRTPGSKEISDSVLRGNSLLRENPAMLQEHEYGLKQDPLYGRIGLIYRGGPQHDALSSAVRYRYADLINQSGELTFNPELYEKAVEDVTGGLVDILGRTVETPMPGMAQETFDQWIDTLSPAYIDAIGVPQGTSENLAAAIRRDDVVLLPIGRNRYALAPAADPNRPIYDQETGKPFLFYYDRELASRTEAQHPEDVLMMEQARRDLQRDLTGKSPGEQEVILEQWREDADTAEDLRMVQEVADDFLMMDRARANLRGELADKPPAEQEAILEQWRADADTAEDLRMVDEVARGVNR